MLAPAVTPLPQLRAPARTGPLGFRVPESLRVLFLVPVDEVRVIVIFVDAGVTPSPLATTSIVFWPLCTGIAIVKTPLPTCAGCPTTSTVASDGVTVPRTVIRSLFTALPSAGLVTCTLAAEADVVLSSLDEPQAPIAAAAAHAASTPAIRRRETVVRSPTGLSPQPPS